MKNWNWINLIKIKVSTKEVIIIFGVIGLVSISLISVSSATKSFQVLATLFFLAIAFSMLGALVGLLFGIPKSNNQINPESSIKKNTNLEEVSDWLTKMIIGFGIAKISEIDDRVLTLVTTLNKIDPELPEIAILLVLIYFPVYGFISGWLATRIYLPPIFADVDNKVENLTDAKKDVPDNINFNASDIDISTDLSTEEIIEGINLLEKEDEKIDGSLYHKLGIILFSRKKYEVSADYFMKSYNLTQNLKSLTNLGVIYNQGFSNPGKAIDTFNEVLKIKPEFPLALYNKACAFARIGNQKQALNNLENAIKYGKGQYSSVAVEDSALLPISNAKKFKELVPNYDPRDDHNVK